MAVIEGSTTGNIAEVDASFDALHVTERPGAVRGSYRIAMASGALNGNPLAANSTVFSFRWTDASYRAVIRYIKAEMFLTSTGHAAQEMGLEMYVARSFSAADSAGTAATLTGNSMKKRTGHSTTLVNDIRICAATLL